MAFDATDSGIHRHYDGRRPWAGVLFDVIDPRAWANTIAFPEERPSALAVACHVARCQHEGLLDDRVPVLWDFGDYQRVMWERPRILRPYREDVAAWRVARRLRSL